jgi:hypothetical protein
MIAFSGRRSEIIRLIYTKSFEGKYMTLNHVSWEMPNGIRSLQNLLAMIEEAANSCETSATKYGNSDGVGYYLDGQHYWLGVYYSDPEYLQFESCTAIDKQQAESFGIGMFEEFSDGREGYFWRRWANLHSEEIHFFARTKSAQVEWLKCFLYDSLVLVRRMELRTSGTNESKSRVEVRKTPEPMIPVDIGGGD